MKRYSITEEINMKEKKIWMLGRSTFQVDGRARSKYLELGAGLASTRSAMRQIRSRIVKEEQSGREGVNFYTK